LRVAAGEQLGCEALAEGEGGVGGATGTEVAGGTGSYPVIGLQMTNTSEPARQNYHKGISSSHRHSQPNESDVVDRRFATSCLYSYSYSYYCSSYALADLPHGRPWQQGEG